MQNTISAGLILESYNRYLFFSLHLFIIILQIKQVYSLMYLAKIGPICTMLLSGGTSTKNVWVPFKLWVASRFEPL